MTETEERQQDLEIDLLKHIKDQIIFRNYHVVATTIDSLIFKGYLTRSLNNPEEFYVSQEGEEFLKELDQLKTL